MRTVVGRLEQSDSAVKLVESFRATPQKLIAASYIGLCRGRGKIKNGEKKMCESS